LCLCCSDERDLLYRDPSNKTVLFYAVEQALESPDIINEVGTQAGMLA
jgi:hypothetical protein